MRLLLFEYVSGGGFNQQALPPSLLTEGTLMLRALLDDCHRLPALMVSVLLDWRCVAIAEGYALTAITVSADTNVSKVFQAALDAVDAVWLLAPEFDGILRTFTEMVECAGKRLLTSTSTAVALTGNKWQCYQRLHAANIATPKTQWLNTWQYQLGEWIIKPFDGVGCSDTWHIRSAQDFAAIAVQLNSPERFIVQPYLVGVSLSLSCVFLPEQKTVLSVNQQVLYLNEQRLSLAACQVNAFPITPAHQCLATHIAQIFPGLYGYVGIDVLQDAQGTLWVVDINPRLTTSYVGLYAALGLNVVALVLQHAPISTPPLRQVKVTVPLHG